MSSNLGVCGEVFGVDGGQPVLGGVDHAVGHRAQGPLQRHLVLQHWGPAEGVSQGRSSVSYGAQSRA